jgi:CubicO group peptidase (beta-lactamase class C family)
MRHRAGFEHGLLDIDAEDSTKWGSQDYLKLVLSEPLVYEPGEKRVYTDAAFYLISRVVTKISGELLDEFLAKRLFNLTQCREFAFSKCPDGYPIGATGLYIRSADVAKLGYIYLNGGMYGETRIFSQEWADTVIKNGYELGKSGDGYAKGGMRGQYLYINFDEKVVVAWHSYDPEDLNGPLHDTLHDFLG